MTDRDEGRTEAVWRYRVSPEMASVKPTWIYRESEPCLPENGKHFEVEKYVRGEPSGDVGEENLIERLRESVRICHSADTLGASVLRPMAREIEEAIARLRRTPGEREAHIGRLLLDSVTPEAWGVLVAAVAAANADVDGPLLERLSEIGSALATQDPNAGGSDE